jgi:hypothetical protein
MPWVRIDEEFPHHPKVVKAGPLGMAMQVAALCYCNRYLTDGFVPRSVAATLLDFSGLGMRMWMGELAGGGEDASWELVVGDLEDAGLWERVEGGWQIHDYHDYQPSREHVLKVREVRREVGRKGGQAKGKQVAKQPPSNGEANAEAKSNPVPVPDTVTTTPFPSPSPDVVSFLTGVGDLPVDNPTNQSRKGKGRNLSRPPRTPRHPSDDFVLDRARQIQAEDGPQAAHAYLLKVAENYGQMDRAEQLHRLETMMAQDAAAEAGQP